MGRLLSDTAIFETGAVILGHAEGHGSHTFCNCTIKFVLDSFEPIRDACRIALEEVVLEHLEICESEGREMNMAGFP
jgi:hypothetical protein